MASKEKFLFLEPLRGIFALVVVFVHGDVVGHTSFLLGGMFFENSRMLIDLFFQLSGFVIAYNYADRIHSFSSAAVFQFNRLLRVYPLHIVTFLVFAVGFPFIKFIKDLVTGNAGDQSAFSNFDFSGVWTELFSFNEEEKVCLSHSFTSFDASEFINNILLTNGIFEKCLSYNYPSWSVSIEFYTYATFALIFFLFASKPLRIVTSIVLVIVSGLILYFTDSVYPETQTAIFRCMYSYYLGVVLFYIYNNFKLNVAPVFVYLSFILMFTCWYYGNFVSSLLTPFTYSFIFLSLLWSGDSIIKRILSAPKLVFLGTVSYGIYMIHAAVYYAISLVMEKIFMYRMVEDPETGNPYLLVDPMLGTALLLLGMVLTVYLAHLSYRYLETPFNNMRIRMPSVSKKIKDRQSVGSNIS
jgi:peptidoglycan/LPS O-acetylase OafA/YrhL